MAAPPSQDTVSDFVARWKNSGASERANYQLFLSELCDVLGVPRPDPAGADDERNAYVFERAVTSTSVDPSSSMPNRAATLPQATRPLRRSQFRAPAVAGGGAPPSGAPQLGGRHGCASTSKRRNSPSTSP